jgi:hypothetical protein
VGLSFVVAVVYVVAVVVVAAVAVAAGFISWLLGYLNGIIDLILPAALWTWGRQPLTEMSTRTLPGGKGQLARGADNLTAICEPIV